MARIITAKEFFQRVLDRDLDKMSKTTGFLGDPGPLNEILNDFVDRL
jgi:hypothetical protein